MSVRTRSVARVAVLMVGVFAVCLPARAAPAAAAAPFDGTRALTIVTVPAIAGVRVVLNGVELTTASDGTIHTVVTKQERTELAAERDAHLTVTTREIRVPGGARARFHGWYDEGYHFSPTDRSGQTLAATFDVDYLTSFTFTDSQRTAVDPRRVTAMQLKDTLGATIDTRGAAPRWLRGRSVVTAGGGVTMKDIEYRLTTVTVNGANVVTRGEQRFKPSHGSRVRVALRLFTVEFRARDAFFGWSRGSAIDIQMGDGTTRHFVLRNGSVTVAGLPPGQYRVKTRAPGLGGEQSFEISGDQTADVEIIGPFDIAIAGVALALMGWGLVLAGRRMRRPNPEAARGAGGGSNEDKASPPGPLAPVAPPAPPVPTWPVRR